eukprot:702247-Rhodomonas_salina.5
MMLLCLWYSPAHGARDGLRVHTAQGPPKSNTFPPELWSVACGFALAVWPGADCERGVSRHHVLVPGQRQVHAGSARLGMFPSLLDTLCLHVCSEVPGSDTTMRYAAATTVPRRKTRLCRRSSLVCPPHTSTQTRIPTQRTD